MKNTEKNSEKQKIYRHLMLPRALTPTERIGRASMGSSTRALGPSWLHTPRWRA